MNTISSILLLLVISSKWIYRCTASNYVLVEGIKSWEDADTYCSETYGTHLASIHSEDDNTEAYEVCAADASTDLSSFVGCWIGYSDLTGSASWSWSDSSSLDFSTFRDGAGNGEQSGALCAFIKVNLDDTQWEDTTCTSHNTASRFLCNAPSYVLVEGIYSWEDADTYCSETYGTNLASIHSQDDNSEAYNLCAADASTDLSSFQGCWIGYSDLTETASWSWSDSTSSNFDNFRDGAGNGEQSGAICAFIKVNLDDTQWEDTTCSLKNVLHRFLCANNEDSSLTDIYTEGDATLLMKGYNMFKNELSGSRVLDPDYESNNTEYYSTAGSVCSYSSLEFTSSYSSYSDYATADSQSVSTSFNAAKYKAGASLSRARTETKSNAMDSESLIYTMDLECAVAEASIVGFDEIIWNKEFINALRILPQSYDESSELDDYIDFWNNYGTHIIVTARFGGNIRGTVIADKCAIESGFGDSSEYEVCLNAAYKAVESDSCVAATDSSSISNAVEKSIKNTRIIVKGGDTSEFTDIFNSFSEKTNNFQYWIDDLVSLPFIIGGNVDEIHDVIQKTIALGNHRLNEHMTTAVDDDTFLLIADALEEAYDDYALQLSEDDIEFQDDECLIDCVGGTVSLSECICSNCAGNCCADKAIAMNVRHIFLCVCLFVLYSL
eukprot:82529_1